VETWKAKDLLPRKIITTDFVKLLSFKEEAIMAQISGLYAICAFPREASNHQRITVKVSRKVTVNFLFLSKFRYLRPNC